MWLWRLNTAFWRLKDYSIYDFIRMYWYNWIEKKKEEIAKLKNIGIYTLEDVEPLVDRIEEQVKQALLKQNYRKIEPYYSKREIGVKKVIEVEPYEDKGGDEWQINKAISKASRRAEKYSNGEGKSRKWKKAKEFLETIASAGYYGYLLLRKKLGIPLEHPTLRPWYAKFLPNIPALINPGGIIFLGEGTYYLSPSTSYTVNTIVIDQCITVKSNIILEGCGYATELRVVQKSNDRVVTVGDCSRTSENAGKLELENVIIRNLRTTYDTAISMVSGIRIMIRSNDTGYINNITVEKVYVDSDDASIVVEPSSPYSSGKNINYLFNVAITSNVALWSHGSTDPSTTKGDNLKNVVWIGNTIEEKATDVQTTGARFVQGLQAGNHIYAPSGHSRSGLDINHQYTDPPAWQGNVVIGNYIENVSSGVSSGHGGILWHGVRGSLCAFNVLNNVGGYAISGWLATIDYCLYIGNIVNSAAYGIYLDSYTSNCGIIGNIINSSNTGISDGGTNNHKAHNFINGAWST